jgi:large subunit ribosomal protein L13
MLKTYSPKPTELTHDWYIIDADGQTLGRLATVVATRLMGKHKPQYAPHMDCGDNIVIINSAKIKVTGTTLETKMYYRHSGYPGGLTELTMEQVMAKNPNRVIEAAIKGMLPKNRLSDVRMKRLRVYPTAEHGHDGQSPQKLEVS